MSGITHGVMFLFSLLCWAMIMRRVKRAALSLFSWLSGEKGLFISDRIHRRVVYLERLLLFMCVYVYVSQQFSRPPFSTALNVHGTWPVPTGPVRAQISDNSYRISNWFCCTSLGFRRGRCSSVCFRRHKNLVPLYIFFRVFKHHTIVPKLRNKA